MPAPLMPSYDLARVASSRTMTEGEPMRARAAHRRAPLFEPGGALGEDSPLEQNRLKAAAAKRAEVLQCSSSHVERHHGSLALRNHQRRGLDHPRKRTCLTGIHHFFFTRAEGSTAAERFFWQKPRSMCAVILASVEIPPAPLSPPQRVMS